MRHYRSLQTLLGGLISIALFVPPAMAGVLRFNVANVSLSQSSVSSGQGFRVNYTLSGSGFGVPGGLLGVRVDYLKGGAVAGTVMLRPGETGTSRGANMVFLEPDNLPPDVYTVRVTALGTGVTAPDYFEVSDSLDANLQFNSPRGVDVNRVAGSPFLGRIYVTEGGAGTTRGRQTVDGLYVLNPDLTPTFPEARARNADIGALGPWGASANSPFRVSVGPDGSVYITDASDAHSGLFVTDPDAGVVRDLFAYPYPAGGARAGSGLVTTSGARSLYGSTSSVWVENNGTGQTVYTTDEDLAPGNSLFRRSIATGSSGNAVLPTLVASPAGATWVQKAVRDSAGSSYIVSAAADDAAKFDASGARITTLPPNTTGYNGLCIDEPRNVLLLATNDGRVFQTDRSFADSAAILTDLGADLRDVAIDAEGWVYAVDATDHLLHVFAPAGDYNVADGSDTAGQALEVTPSPLPGDVAPIGPGGLYLAESGQRYGDGRIDLLDTVMVLRMAFGLQTAP